MRERERQLVQKVRDIGIVKIKKKRMRIPHILNLDHKHIYFRIGSVMKSPIMIDVIGISPSRVKALNIDL